MQTVAVQFLDQGFHRVLFNAMPMPVFVVDKDVSILEYNTAAADLLGKKKHSVLLKRCGDVLECLNAEATPEGCGRAPDCCECVVRKAVGAAFRGRAVNRKLAQVPWLGKGKGNKMNLRVSAHPVDYDQQKFVLLMLEGLND